MEDLELHRKRISHAVFMCAQREMERIIEAHETGTGLYEPTTDGYIVVFTPDSKQSDSQNLFDMYWKAVDWDGGEYDYGNECFVMVKMTASGLPITVIVDDFPWVEDACPGFLTRLHEYTEV
jgi:hypothetical protein